MPLSFFSTDWIIAWVQEPTWLLAWLLFVNILWIPLAWSFLKEVGDAYHNWIAGINAAKKRKMIWLAIDVPSDGEQTPASMEAIFNQLAGAHGSANWWEQHWVGEFQEWFSFEIVSLEGYVQYIINCHENFRDLVEAAVYAQYPDAEISEVTDYAKDVPGKYPNDEWDFFGTDYLFALPDAYPIRSYHEFEDRVRGEYIDPMAAMLEIMSKIGKGEQIWYQVLALPIVDKDWVPQAKKEIDKFLERELPPEPAKGILGKGAQGILKVFGWISDLLAYAATAIFQVESEVPEKREKQPKSLQELTPGEKTLLEDMERKTGKLAYKCRIRILYAAKKDVYNKARGVGPVVGAIKQFNDASKNWFKVGSDAWTKTQYSFKKARLYLRQRAFYQAYVDRSLYAGSAPGGFIMNAEELATVYHFPLASVKAPLLKRTGAKKSEPPPTLPTEEGGMSVELPEHPEPSKAMPAPSVKPKPPKTEPEPSGLAVPTAEDEVRFVELPEDNAPEEAPPNLPVG